MKLRILAGTYGGRLINTPRGNATHPMGERVRGALANSLYGRVYGAYICDLYAGSGAVGLELLSRGANGVVGVENGKYAQECIKKNLDQLAVKSDRYRLFKGSVSRFLSAYQGCKFDIVVADPPYDQAEKQLSTVWKIKGLLKPNGLMVISIPGKGVEAVPNEFVVVDNRSYGGAQLLTLTVS